MDAACAADVAVADARTRGDEREAVREGDVRVGVPVAQHMADSPSSGYDHGGQQ